MGWLILLQTTPAGLVPISGYILCFLPLAAVIIGFIVAARATDRQATATYLRILPSSDTAPAPAKPAAVAAPAVAVAPAVAATPATTTTGVTIAHIEFDPPGRDIDGEYVLVSNTTAGAIDMSGWTLIDGDAKHTFTFPSFILAAGAEVKIWSKDGTNNATNLYWGSIGAIWNNTGDTGTLSDTHGKVVSSYTYAGT
jgi:Lamin Tail Domain